MNRIYEKYGEAVFSLAKQIDIKNTTIAPVVFGGVPPAELLMYYYAPTHDGSVLENAFYASSKTEDPSEIKVDEIKFADILFNVHQKGSYIVYLDERTKSGKLGEGLNKKTREWEAKTGLKVNSKFAVLFDPYLKADMRGSLTYLSDNERLVWASEDEYKKFIYNKDGKLLYDIESSKIRNLNHIHDIKMEIDALILEEKERDVIKRPELPV